MPENLFQLPIQRREEADRHGESPESKWGSDREEEWRRRRKGAVGRGDSRLENCRQRLLLPPLPSLLVSLSNFPLALVYFPYCIYLILEKYLLYFEGDNIIVRKTILKLYYLWTCTLALWDPMERERGIPIVREKRRNSNIVLLSSQFFFHLCACVTILFVYIF